MFIWVLIAVLVIIVVMWINTYNGLVKSRMYVKESWSQIDVQLKRRNDLIPNLVETVKGYAKFEEGTLEKVVSLRNQLTQVPAGDHEQMMALSNELSAGLKSVFAVAESYPDLKASTQYNKLMEELTNTENKIGYARQLYNSSVSSYDTKLETFPTNIVAGVHNFKPEAFLETPTEEKAVPTVSFGDDGK